jgi:hypothetical protein
MSNVHILNLAAYETPTIQESKRDEWVEYGSDNDYFSFLIDRYTNSPTNNAIINNISRLVYGKGLSATDASRKPNEYAQMMAMLNKEDIRKVVKDFKMLGNAAMQIHYTKDRKKIQKVYHIPVNLIRAEKCNKDGEIEGYYYSDNWNDVKKYAPKRIPAFGYSQEQIEILYIMPYSVGMKYYAYPDYLGALPYATLEEEIADYLVNEVQNGFSGTKVVNFNSGVPSEEQQQIISSKVLGKLTGSRGQKVIVAFNNNETEKTTVDDIPLNDAAEQYQYLSDECMRKLMLAHNVTSPLLFGIASTNGFSSNADELRNSAILFENMVIKPIQELLIDAFDRILAYNGISLDLKFEGLNPLDAEGDLTNTEGSKVIEGINSLSPLVANKVLESMTPNEIRALVGLSPEQGGSDLAPAQLSAIDKLDVYQYGEDIDLDEWELIDSRVVDYDMEEDYDKLIYSANKPTLMSRIVSLVKTGTAYAKRNSEQDNDVFRTRYRYIGEISDKSRPFCKAMIKANKLYRKEDIIAMEDQIVNEGFGPKGSDKYSIWLYKGGGACHHAWQRETYRRKGTDLTSPLAKTVTPAQQRKEGYIAPVNDKKVYQRPIDMPNQGFLPK